VTGIFDSEDGFHLFCYKEKEANVTGGEKYRDCKISFFGRRFL